MTTRFLFIAIATWLSPFIAGCAKPIDGTNGRTSASRNPREVKPPLAPMPRVKPLPSDLIAGKWKVVSIDRRHIPTEWVYTLTFFSNHAYESYLDDGTKPPTANAGSYVIGDGKITLTADAPTAGIKSRTIYIRSLSKERLITSLSESRDVEYMIFERPNK